VKVVIADTTTNGIPLVLVKQALGHGGMPEKWLPLIAYDC
jgi:hypothetical protein